MYWQPHAGGIVGRRAASSIPERAMCADVNRCLAPAYEPTITSLALGVPPPALRDACMRCETSFGAFPRQHRVVPLHRAAASIVVARCKTSEALRSARSCGLRRATSKAEQRHRRQMKLADQPRLNASCLPSTALHARYCCSGRTHSTDLSTSSDDARWCQPLRAARPRSCSFAVPSAAVRQMKLADKQQAKLPRVPSTALHRWFSFRSCGSSTGSFGRCAPMSTAASVPLMILACSRGCFCHF